MTGTTPSLAEVQAITLAEWLKAEVEATFGTDKDQLAAAIRYTGREPVVPETDWSWRHDYTVGRLVGQLAAIRSAAYATEPLGIEGIKEGRSPDDEFPSYGGNYHLTPEAQGINGYQEVYQRRDGFWEAVDYTSGGGSISRHITREEAVEDLLKHRARHAGFWDHWVAVAEAGYRDSKGRQVLVVNGRVFTIGAEPRLNEHGRPARDADLLGMGGRRNRFHLLADGTEVVSHNVWYSGIVPTEYRDRIPDNATGTEVLYPR